MKGGRCFFIRFDSKYRLSLSFSTIINSIFSAWATISCFQTLQGEKY
ncbi:hypothetical protein IKO18_05380 [bacterium]|nr:hypothetical protein [bacterium]